MISDLRLDGILLQQVKAESPITVTLLGIMIVRKGFTIAKILKGQRFFVCL